MARRMSVYSRQLLQSLVEDEDCVAVLAGTLCRYGQAVWLRRQEEAGRVPMNKGRAQAIGQASYTHLASAVDTYLSSLV